MNVELDYRREMVESLLKGVAAIRLYRAAKIMHNEYLGPLWYSVMFYEKGHYSTLDEQRRAHDERERRHYMMTKALHKRLKINAYKQAA